MANYTDGCFSLNTQADVTTEQKYSLIQKRIIRLTDYERHKMPDTNAFRDYIRSLRDNLVRGDSTEHTHRPALKILLEAAQPGIIATNEPARIECGAPDFAISANGLTIGYIEAKRCDISLDAIERGSNRKNPNSDNGKQLKRYRDALPNLILTNYTEFRWYVDGERRLTATLASDDGSGELTTHHDGITDTAELLSAFFAQSPEPVSSPKELSRRMARLTHLIRDVVREAFVKEQVSQDVNSLYEATKRMLVADLSLDDFADMFAQTLAYGLFAARVNHKSGDFQRRTAVYDIPAANPFLKEIFALVAGYRAESEPFIGFVDDLAQLLANSDMEAILSDFGKRGVREDPIMHFYEDFLKDYDPALREKRGVYYTPEPVISYIVRSVDHLLRERFDCPEGLADYQTADYETLEDIDGRAKAGHKAGSPRSGARPRLRHRLIPLCRHRPHPRVLPQQRQYGSMEGLCARTPAEAHLRLRVDDGPLRNVAPEAGHATLPLKTCPKNSRRIGLTNSSAMNDLAYISPTRWSRRNGRYQRYSALSVSSPRKPTPHPKSSVNCPSWWCWATRPTRDIRPTPAA